MVIINGYTVHNSRKNEVIEELEQFFKDNMDADVYVDDYFFLGLSLIVEFQCASDRRLILQRKSNLKDFRGGNIYINEYTPITTLEKRKRERQIIQQLDEVAKDQQVNINVEYTHAGLTVQGVPYRKQVVPPSPKDLVELDLQDLDHILHLNMIKGKQVVHENSKFQAFIASATTHQQIRQFYMKLKLTRPTARHIVCAYVIPGPVHTSCDFHDDGEPGSGRILLQYLLDNNIKDKVIFVVRKYGGVKIGSSRFSCYKQAVDSAFREEFESSTCSIETTMAPPPTRRPRNLQQTTSTPQQHRLQMTAPPATSTQQHSSSNQRSNAIPSHYPRGGSSYRGGSYRGRNNYRGGPRNRSHNRGVSGRGNRSGNSWAPIRKPYGSTQQNTRTSRYDQFVQENLQQTLRQFNFSNPTNSLTLNEQSLHTQSN